MGAVQEICLEDRLNDQQHSHLDHPVSNTGDGGREMHIVTARIWAGLRSLIPFILSGVSDFEFSKLVALVPFTLSSWQVLLRGPLLFPQSGQIMLPLRFLATRISLSTHRFSP